MPVNITAPDEELPPVGRTVYGSAMSTPGSDDHRGHVVLRLGVTGQLGEMDYPTVLRVLQRSYELLQRTAHRVLGDRADDLHWSLTGLRESSAMTLVRTDVTDDVTESELQEVAQTYTRDLSSPAERLPEEDVPILRDLLQDLQRTRSGGLLAEVVGVGSVGPAVVEPAQVLPMLIVRMPMRQQVIGSVTGRLETLNVHGRREAALWNELDQRRVVVSFAEEDYQRVHAAVRQRVEVFGTMQEDADGRPLRIRLQDLDVLARDEDLPTLSSLAGSMPNITGELTAQEYLNERRRDLGHG